VSLSKHQLLGLAVAGVALVVVALGWRSSAVGIAFRAVQENSVTAQSFGIPVETWRSYSVGAACAMSGIAGIAHCFDNHMYPQSGFDSAFVGIACVVIGGRRHLWQPLLGAFVISLTKNLGAYWLPHNWEPTLTMGAMLITLLFSPEWRRPYVGQLG
jgi:branched-subunit amino acid ABC-type transport system permease component